ncbi:MAG: hypothetical protein MI975_15345 [Cytophagales bacterium]|nr:hypothetical protein [Cytophagales bacterium]
MADTETGLFCDIRMRLRVGGVKYAFAGSNRLRDKLKAIGIKYRYHDEPAPTHLKTRIDPPPT